MEKELNRLEKSWSTVARRDLLQAILCRRDHAWTNESFFQTGKDDFNRIASIADAHGARIDRDTDVLDFGCGIGRLSLPAAEVARSVIGVDISEEMIRSAPIFVANGAAPTYLQCRSPELESIASSSVDLVMSLITFQHLSPMLGSEYVRALVRILRPNGLLVFDVASAKSPERSLRGRLPSWAFRVSQMVHSWLDPYARIRMNAWSDDAVRVLIDHAGLTLLDSREVDSAGPRWISYLYCARKPGTTAMEPNSG